MKEIFLIVLGMLLVHPSFAQEVPPYETAILLTGENLNSAIFLGMYDEAVAQNHTPDVLVGSCGGSLGAAIINQIDSKEDRIALIKSPEFHKLLRSVEVTGESLFSVQGKIMAIVGTANDRLKLLDAIENPKTKPFETAYDAPPTQKFYNFFNFALFNLGNQFQQPVAWKKGSPDFVLSGGFRTSPRTVITGSEFLVDPQKFENSMHIVLPAEQIAFREIMMTDPETARYLENLEAPAAMFPGAPIEKMAQVRTDFTVGEAVRISVTDPNLVPAFKKDGHVYMGGAINIDPVNIAKRLAKVVIGRYPGLFSADLEQPDMLASFGFDGNRVRKQMVREKADYWVDATAGDFPNFAPKPSPKMTLVTGVPESYEEYLKMVDAQYAYGVNRTREALTGEKYSTKHIRKPIIK